MYVQYNDHFENHYIMMNRDLWDSLSAADQAAVREAAVEVMDARFPVAEESDNAYMRELEAAGIEVVTLDAAQAAQFAAVARRDVWPDIKDEIGDELYRRLKSELGLE